MKNPCRPPVLLSLSFSLFTITLTSCIGGGGDSDGTSLTVDPDPIRQSLAECTAVGIRDYSKLADAIMGLLEAIDIPGSPPAGITFDPGTGTFTLDLDLDGEGTADTFVDGVIRAPFDQLSDGFDPGESFRFDLISTGLVDVTGQLGIAFNGSVGDPNYPIHGDLHFSDDSPCEFTATNVNATLFFRGGKLEATGVIEFIAVNSSDQMQGFISLAPEQDPVVNATDALGPVMFYVNSNTFVPYIE